MECKKRIEKLHNKNERVNEPKKNFNIECPLPKFIYVYILHRRSNIEQIDTQQNDILHDIL